MCESLRAALCSTHIYDIYARHISLEPKHYIAKESVSSKLVVVNEFHRKQFLHNRSVLVMDFHNSESAHQTQE